MRRPLVLPIVALLAVACSDANRPPTSLDGGQIVADVNSPPGGSCIGDPSDPATATDYNAWKIANRESPCDAAAQERNSEHQPGTEGFYFLPPTVGAVDIDGTPLSGVADYIFVEWWPVGGNCADPTPGSGCAPITDQHPTEVLLADGTIAFQYQWKNYNRGPAAQRVPTESIWRAWVTLELDGVDPIFLGYRDINLTESPNRTQPANGETRDENYGRNVNIIFTFADLGGCSGDAGDSVQCVINFAEGGDITVGQTTVSFGQNSQLGVGVATVTDNCSLDLDIPALPGSACLTLDLAPVPPQGTALNNTYAYFCGIDPLVAATGAIYQQSQGFGTWALPPASDAGVCDAFVEEGSGLERLFSKLASAFGLGPKPLVASLLSHSTRGGGLSFCCSEFEFRQSSSMAAVDPTTSAALPTQQHSPGRIGPLLQAAAGEQKTVAVKVVDHDGQAVSGATVHGFTDANGSVTPSQVTTGADGLASFTVTVGNVNTRFWALGCGVGIEGSSAALTTDNRGGGIGFQAAGIAADELPGDLEATCDRDPRDTDTGTDFGPLTSTDPFIAPADQSDGNCPGDDCSALRVPVAIDDVPIEYLFEVCGAPAVDGDKDLAAGEWSDRCTDSYDFTANTTGKAKPGNATLRWTIVNDTLYGAIEIRDAQAKDLNDAFFYLDLSADVQVGTVGDPYLADLAEGDDVVVMRLDDQIVATDHVVPLQCEGSPKASLCSTEDSGADPNQAFGAARSGVDTDGVDGANDLFWEFSKSLLDADCGEDLCLGDLPYVGGSGTITGGQGGGKGGTTVPEDGGFILMELR
jgi:hypothetical protein